MNVLRDKRIVLGVTGSIAAYKAAALASSLNQHGALVDVIMTESAKKFISPLTFQALTGRKTYTDEDPWGDLGHQIPIEEGHNADLVIIAPCSANTIAKINHGISDNLLSIVCLTATCPIIIVPALDIGMFKNDIFQSNLNGIKERGIKVISPMKGQLA